MIVVVNLAKKGKKSKKQRMQKKGKKSRNQIRRETYEQEAKRGK